MCGRIRGCGTRAKSPSHKSSLAPVQRQAETWRAKAKARLLSHATPSARILNYGNAVFFVRTILFLSCFRIILIFSVNSSPIISFQERVVRMKFSLLFALVVCMFALTSAQEKTSGVVTLYVSGMHCSGCAANVSEALKAVKGVGTVTVSLEAKTAEVHFSSGSTVANDDLLKAIADAGYKGSTTKPTAEEPSEKKHDMKKMKGATDKDGGCKDGCDKDKKKEEKKS